MKKKFTLLVLILTSLIGASSFIKKNLNGIAGYTGSPGESTCSACHNGGSAAASGITITTVPAFSVNANSETEYMPDSTYQVSISMSATGFTRYGFATEILDDSFNGAGTFPTLGSGVKLLGLPSKRTLVHTTPKIASSGTAVFTFKWTAPSSGNATIYTIGNAVNGNNAFTGDFVISPINISLVAAPTPTVVVIDTDIRENTKNALSNVSVFPNPANGFTTVSYDLRSAKNIQIQLFDLNGSKLKDLSNTTQYAGSHEEIVNLNGIKGGVYFVRILSDGQKMSQKLISIL